MKKADLLTAHTNPGSCNTDDRHPGNALESLSCPLISENDYELRWKWLPATEEMSKYWLNEQASCC